MHTHWSENGHGTPLGQCGQSLSESVGVGIGVRRVRFHAHIIRAAWVRVADARLYVFANSWKLQPEACYV